MSTHEVTIADSVYTVDMGPRYGNVSNVSVSSSLRTMDMAQNLKKYGASVTDTLEVSATQSPLWRRVVVLEDVLRLTELNRVTSKFGLTCTERLRSFDRVSVRLPLTISDTLEIASSVASMFGVTLVEALRFDAQLHARQHIGLTVTERLRMRDALRRFVSGTLTSTLAIGGGPSYGARYRVTAAEQLRLSEQLAPVLTLHIAVADQLDLTADLLPQALYQAELREQLIFEIAATTPSGGITTWVINTKTNAITEYRNYEFNGFAQCGRRYIGTADDGLYELIGERDYGSLIISDIKSGAIQLGNTQFTAFQAAYIAVRGEGDFILRLISGDGTAYDYAAKATSMANTRVNLGKGLRSRYFTFELISTGQDFDLDNIEFIPLVARRRV